MPMQDFFLSLSPLTVVRPAVLKEELKAIYSNSNILFLHKDAEILFSGFGFTFYGLRSFHV